MVKQERAGRTRQAVLLAAAETFARVGFEAASLVDISRRAGVSKGALYFHFVSKRALADGVRHAAGREVGSAALRALRADGPALQSLIDFSHELARLLREDLMVRAGVRLGCRGSHRDGAAVGPEVAWGSLAAVVHRLLERAAEAGELCPGVDRRSAAELLTAAAAGQVLIAGEEAGRPGPEAVSRLWTAALPALVTAENRAGYRL
ncbi:ScbR family autoregulator-binding transcription factor [Kitasatospora brasiliensis]|uniref:ScbR family autoregulator-binding transcription factor n=1 Tax=Kitasatospora brasiliensis TaxID=3058040 RepID=UPI0029308B28|nr:ScbR family autoregulator-binding transcription factor [Kitasatospora sp. K002]